MTSTSTATPKKQQIQVKTPKTLTPTPSVKQVVEKFEKFDLQQQQQQQQLKPIKGWAARLSANPLTKSEGVNSLRGSKSIPNFSFGIKGSTNSNTGAVNSLQAKLDREKFNDEVKSNSISVTSISGGHTQTTSETGSINKDQKESEDQNTIYEPINQFNAEQIKMYLSSSYHSIIDTQRAKSQDRSQSHGDDFIVKFYKNAENSSWVKPGKKRNSGNNTKENNSNTGLKDGKENNGDGFDVLFEINKALSNIGSGSGHAN